MKNERREALNKDIEAFLNAGGQIEQIPAKEEKKTRKRTFKSQNEREANYRDYLSTLSTEYKQFVGVDKVERAEVK